MNERGLVLTSHRSDKKNYLATVMNRINQYKRLKTVRITEQRLRIESLETLMATIR